MGSRGTGGWNVTDQRGRYQMGGLISRAAQTAGAVHPNCRSMPLPYFGPRLTRSPVVTAEKLIGVSVDDQMASYFADRLARPDWSAARLI